MRSEGGEAKIVYNILREIFDRRGFDISSHRISSLQYRISRRIDVLGMESLTEYAEYLKTNPAEYNALFNTILVNSSQFFRDSEAWNFVRDTIVPRTVAKIEKNITDKKELRIWSAGCASGEETYSMAIMLLEFLKDNPVGITFRIHATDIDESALKIARSGTYQAYQLADIPEHIKERYFVEHDGLYTVRSDVRRLLIFSRNNLVSDPPIPRIDLLICRNVLIYLEPTLQATIISKFQYALNDGGYLWLGKSEKLVNGSEYGLKPLDTKWHIFKKVHPLTHSCPGNAKSESMSALETKTNHWDDLEHDVEFSELGIIMLDEGNKIAMCNQAAYEICFSNYNDLENSDPDFHSDCIHKEDCILGRSFFDFRFSHQSIDMKYRIEHAINSNESLVADGIRYWLNEETCAYLQIQIIPLKSNYFSGTIITVKDITNRYETGKRHKYTMEALKAANEKLLSENVELKAGNRELELTNRNLQSANRELESVNEEMKAINEELTLRNFELSRLRLHYEEILNRVDSSVIVTDESLLVNDWNSAAANMWGVKQDEIVGRSIMEIDSGPSLASLADQFMEVMETGRSATSVLEYRDDQGREVKLDISINPLIKGKVEGLVLVVK